jgi:hypothetical protein
MDAATCAACSWRRTQPEPVHRNHLNTFADEIAVCNLGSVNLPNHISKDGGVDTTKLVATIKTKVRIADTTSSTSTTTSVPQAKNSNPKHHRPVGLHYFQDAVPAAHRLRFLIAPSASPTSQWKQSATTLLFRPPRPK